MQLFSVPQFIEMEGKVVGPLTLKQFLFILAMVGISFILYKSLPKILSIPLIIVTIASGISFAFLKIKEIPFYKIVLDAINFIFVQKRFVWGKGRGEYATLEKVEFKKEKKFEPKLKTEGKLKDFLIQIETKK
jgi:hypothetical protein